MSYPVAAVIITILVLGYLLLTSGVIQKSLSEKRAYNLEMTRLRDQREMTARAIEAKQEMAEDAAFWGSK
jgi:hypothetical protein